MPVSSNIAQHLPHLRRFARALSGSQSSGDAYVASLLEVIGADPSSFPDNASPRVALYKAFTRVWNSVSLNLEGNAAGEEDHGAADRTIEVMTPLPRQAFLLHSVEAFDIEEVATILDMPVSEVTALIDEAGQEIAAHIATEVLIIEDEPVIAFDLEGIVESLGHRVIGIARTHSDAIRVCRERTPGLVLADIQLAGEGSGIEAVNDLLQSWQVPVIFVTAYPERLLTGARPEPTFLITKPYRSETVKAIISQSLFFEKNARCLPRER